MQSSSAQLHYTSHFAPLPNGDQIHLRRIHLNAEGPPVLLVHGAIENGRIFYTEDGKGYAPFLAQAGYDVFVADQRGRGLSTPAVHAGSQFGLSEFIDEDFPAMLSLLEQLRGRVPVHWGAHSWGGVMLLAYLARHASPLPVISIVQFGVKRRISVRNLSYQWMIGFGWNIVGSWIVRRKGYLDAVRFKMGADNESAKTYHEMNIWINDREWKHWEEDFDFSEALSRQQLPPTLYLAGARDRVLGHPTDVQILADETGEQDRAFQLLSKKNGHLHDYGHINMLTHPLARQDHFPLALEWMRQAEQKMSLAPHGPS